MGVWDNMLSRIGLRGRAAAQAMDSPSVSSSTPTRGDGDYAIGVLKETAPDVKFFETFNDSNITFSGSLVGYNYTNILRDKQKNIVELYKLSDYYYDADPIYGGVIKHVYVPFSMISPYRLVGADEKVIAKYQAYYDRINLRDKMESIFLQRYKYGNVFIYIMPDGNIITLPVHKCRIANMALNGEPIVEFETKTIVEDFKAATDPSSERFVKDSVLQQRLKGYPPEVAVAVRAGHSWAQLDPENVLVIQGEKEDWARYAVPMIATCLPSLAKKALISKYEDAIINLGMRGFVHVRYGDEKSGYDNLVDGNQLRQVARIFSSAMSGMPLAVTNQWAKAEFIQAESERLFEYDKYKDVNRETLAAGGINSIIVNGSVEGGSNFGTAQISMQVAVVRIERSLKDFADMMNKLNVRMNSRGGGVTRTRPDKVPTFMFQPLDASGKRALQEAGMKLYQQGVLSVQSLLDNYGYDVEQEAARIESEQERGFHDVFVPLNSRVVNKLNPEDGSEPEHERDGVLDTPGKRGRPEKDIVERTSDVEQSDSGRVPKPSQPDNDPVASDLA